MKNIVSVEWLNENLSDENLIILDASPQSNKSGLVTENQNIQIPSARFFDLEKVFSDQNAELPNTLLSPADFQKEVRKLGINNDSKLVVYDNLGIYASPRVWWMFKTMGHHDIAVLDGGLPEWVKSGLPTEPIFRNNFSEGNFKASFKPEAVKNADDILRNITDSEAVVIDARSAGRFKGIAPEPRKGLRSGSIPNSKNLPFQDVLQNGKFKSTLELKETFENLNLENKPLIFSCGSGLTACIILLANELVNDSPKAVYDGSWTEWAQLYNV